MASFVSDAFQSLNREGRKFLVKVIGGGFVGVMSPTASAPGHTTETLDSYAAAVEELYGFHLVSALVDKAFAESATAQALKQLLR